MDGNAVFCLSLCLQQKVKELLNVLATSYFCHLYRSLNGQGFQKIFLVKCLNPLLLYLYTIIEQAAFKRLLGERACAPGTRWWAGIWIWLVMSLYTSHHKPGKERNSGSRAKGSLWYGRNAPQMHGPKRQMRRWGRKSASFSWQNADTEPKSLWRNAKVGVLRCVL